MIHKGYQNFMKNLILSKHENIFYKNINELFFYFWGITCINLWSLKTLLGAMSHIFSMIIIVILAGKVIYVRASIWIFGKKMEISFIYIDFKTLI